MSLDGADPKWWQADGSLKLVLRVPKESDVVSASESSDAELASEEESCEKVSNTEVECDTDNQEEGKNNYEEREDPTSRAESNIKTSNDATGSRLHMGTSSQSSMTQFTPLQLLLDYYLRVFEKKDPEHYFLYPVSDKVAPKYSKIIKTPIDFIKIRRKIIDNEYRNLLELKNDMELIAQNAFTYNQPNTVYSIAARKLMGIIEHMFSKVCFFQRCISKPSFMLLFLCKLRIWVDYAHSVVFYINEYKEHV
ncbi:unnamed protein product [Soboliphyme baturini]|uniref:Bromo domain-containing protein n=1 Tax=Soboliphyme baturini TaxID=241478 RepID=A0A183IJM7_9BILA|nr:unnamed protein product [Soboliphyme baturini]